MNGSTGVAVVTIGSYSACVTLLCGSATDPFCAGGAGAGASDTSGGVRSCTCAVSKGVAVLTIGMFCAEERRFGIDCVEECRSSGVHRHTDEQLQ